jgi:hypothetical protein
MRKKRYSLSLVAACLTFALIVATGCGESAAPRQEEVVAGRDIAFEQISPSLEVKKMQADERGVLWILTHEKNMYTLDPDLYLSELSVCGEGIEDFALGGAGKQDDPAA